MKACSPIQIHVAARGRKRRITARRGRFLAHQSCRCPCGARLVNPPGGCYMTAPPKVPVSVPKEAHSAHRGTYQSRDPPPRTAASCYLYGVACLQNACRKMRGGAPSTTAGSTPVPRPPPGVLWVGSNRPWRARVAIYHPRRAAPLGAWAGPCAAVTWNFTYKTDGAEKPSSAKNAKNAVWRKSRRKP